MQTGRSSLLSLEDAENLEYLQKIFGLRSKEEAEEISIFFKSNLPTITMDAETEH
jgi:hypothetical protein